MVQVKSSMLRSSSITFHQKDKFACLMHESTKKTPFLHTLLTVFLEQNNWEFTIPSTGVFQQEYLSGLGKSDLTFLDQADFGSASQITKFTGFPLGFLLLRLLSVPVSHNTHSLT